jgi:apolipoprotein N-acyltransferase
MPDGIVTPTSRPLWLIVPVALVGGALTALAFSPTSVVAFAILGPATGLWACARARTGRRGTLCGVAYGAAFTYAAYRWMLELDAIAYVVLPLLQAVFWAFTGLVAARTAHLPRGWWVAAVTATWTLAEAARARFPMSGFEWGQLGVATADTPLRRAAAVAGVLGVTGVLVAVAAGLAVVVADRRLRSGVPLALSTLALGALVALGSVTWTTPDGTLHVAVVQSENPCPGAFAEDCPGYIDELLETYVAGTAALSTTPDLIVWGEDALIGAETLDAVGRQFVDSFGPLQAPLLAGTATPAGPGRFYRQAALFDRDGAALDDYAKRQPVPFGEYVPFRSLLGGISDVGRLVPSDAVPGRDTSPIVVPTSGDPAMLGTVVSWEVTFSRLVRDVGRDANGLATLTTVSSYGRSAASDQLLDAAQMRAAEQQKPMVVAATTGSSGVVLPTGELQETTALLRADSLTADMPLHAGLTPFGRTGDVPMVVLAIAALSLVFWRARNARRDGTPAMSPAPSAPSDVEAVDSALRG